MRITDKQVSWIAAAGVLFTFASEVLSDFEKSMVADLCRRFIRLGPEMYATDEEWAAFEVALNGMVNHACPAYVVEVESAGYGRGVSRAVPYQGRH